jgi:hypothetical protein
MCEAFIARLTTMSIGGRKTSNTVQGLQTSISLAACLTDLYTAALSDVARGGREKSDYYEAEAGCKAASGSSEGAESSPLQIDGTV